MKYLVIVALSFIILNGIAAPVEIPNIVAVVNGNAITMNDVRTHPQVRGFIVNEPNAQDKPEEGVSLLQVMESALNELILDYLIADHIKNMARVKQQQWKHNFSKLPKEQKSKVKHQLEQKGNVRIVPESLVTSLK